MDNKVEKNKKRFNIIDFLIILVVAALVFSIALRYNLADRVGLSSRTDEVTISFLVQETSPTTIDAFVLGDEFYIDQNSVLLGTLLSVQRYEAEQYYENEDGEMILSYTSAYIDIRGEIKASGSMTESGFMLNGTTFIAPNKKITVKSKNVTCDFIITSVTVNGDNQ